MPLLISSENSSSAALAILYEQEADRVARQVMNTPDAVATASAERAPSLGGAQIQTPASKSVAASVTPMVQGQIRQQIQAEEGKDSDEEKEDLLQAKRFRESLRLQRKIATEEERRSGPDPGKNCWRTEPPL